MSHNPSDQIIPGAVYLCQTGEAVSCGACCGLYNVANPSRPALESMLASRTRRFARVPRTVEGILGFKEESESGECRERPWPEFHHCPYIGLIGEQLSRVGCLLHPLGSGNKGVDFRGLSYYGGMACRSYFCPACKELPKVYKEIIRAVAEDWYVFGLMVTEKELLAAFFREVEKRMGRPLCASDVREITENPSKAGSVRKFLEFRVRSPFGFSAHRCNYFFEDRLYRRSPVDYEAFGAAVSPYDTIFRELAWKIDSAASLSEAEKMMDNLFNCLVNSLADCPPL